MGGGGGVGADEVLAAVRDRWDLADVVLAPLAGGMNSRTWTVVPVRGEKRRSGERWVAKLVRPDQHDGFTRGLDAAALVDAAGVPAGRPLPTRDGGHHVDLPGGVLALLQWVEGDPLLGTSQQDHLLIGGTLGAVHAVLRGAADASAVSFPAWLDPDADHLAVED